MKDSLKGWSVGHDICGQMTGSVTLSPPRRGCAAGCTHDYVPCGDAYFKSTGISGISSKKPHLNTSQGVTKSDLHTLLLSMYVKTILHTAPSSDDQLLVHATVILMCFFDGDIIYFFICFTAFQTEGKLYLILEFLRGGDLFTRLSKEVFQCYNR